MDWDRIIQQTTEYLRKYRYAWLILGIGILLLCIPEKKETYPSVEPAKTEIQQTRELQTQLSELLSRMEGAGKVQVLLTQASGESYRYQTDEEHQTDGDGMDLRKETVIVANENRAQGGLITRVDPPVYLGAVVLCQGADSANIRLALTEAVKSATGLSADKITVLKMK